uniref:(California timema) hypothetical protein n=1 Tax=Timema californicum TaxID=61474 RepID=A0A7R9J707_TIMCA|nr:unnamed protein product [Timema californicum]
MSGDLYIYNAGPSDGYKSYACRTVHRLTGEVHSSTYPGRIIITGTDNTSRASPTEGSIISSAKKSIEPKGSVQPRITVEKHVTKQVKAGDDITLPCVAQGFPVPTYRWFREDRDQLLAVNVGERVSVLAAGLLRIAKVRLEDKGKYLCWVNNSAGEETVQVTLTVSEQYCLPLSISLDSHCRDILLLHRDSRCRDFLMFHRDSHCRDILQFHRDYSCRNTLTDLFSTPTHTCLNTMLPSAKHTPLKDDCRISSVPLNDIVLAMLKPELKLWCTRLDEKGNLSLTNRVFLLRMLLARAFMSCLAITLHSSVLLLCRCAPLSAHVQPQNQVVDVGKEAVFQCIPGGHPVAKVAWYRNGKPVVRDARFEVLSSPEKLMVRALQKEDHGMYQCFVSNEWDMAQATAELQLGDASPELLYWFTEQTIQPGPAVSLKCVATGNPPPQFIWTLDGFPVPDNPRSKGASLILFSFGQMARLRFKSSSGILRFAVYSIDAEDYCCSRN